MLESRSDPSRNPVLMELIRETISGQWDAERSWGRIIYFEWRPKELGRDHPLWVETKELFLRWPYCNWTAVWKTRRWVSTCRWAQDREGQSRWKREAEVKSQRIFLGQWSRNWGFILSKMGTHYSFKQRYDVIWFISLIRSLRLPWQEWLGGAGVEERDYLKSLIFCGKAR